MARRLPDMVSSSDVDCNFTTSVVSRWRERQIGIPHGDQNRIKGQKQAIHLIWLVSTTLFRIRTGSA